MLNQRESKLTCTVLGYDKRHHTFLHNPKYSQYNIIKNLKRLQQMKQMIRIKTKTLTFKIILEKNYFT